jgi:hypothetical protein
MSDAEKQARLSAVQNAKAGIENFKDPVSDQQLDLSQSFPDSRTRTYMGKKIGFASEENATKWDSMTAQEKAQKFAGCQSIDVKSDLGRDQPAQAGSGGSVTPNY